MIAQGAAIKKAWIQTKKEGAGKEAVIFVGRLAKEITDQDRDELVKVLDAGKGNTAELLKRKWISKKYGSCLK